MSRSLFIYKSIELKCCSRDTFPSRLSKLCAIQLFLIYKRVSSYNGVTGDAIVRVVLLSIVNTAMHVFMGLKHCRTELSQVFSKVYTAPKASQDQAEKL